MTEPTFTCPACGGTHFGRDTGETPDGIGPLETVRCNDEHDTGCHWRGKWPNEWNVKIVASDEGGFTASLPEVPGCFSEGETLYDTLINLADAADFILSPPDADEISSRERANEQRLLGDSAVRLLRLETLDAPAVILENEAALLAKRVAAICRRKRLLTREEKLLIADALNGCGMSLEHDPTWLGLMCGEEGALADCTIEGQDAFGRIELTGRVCSGLEHEVYDAILLNKADQIWEVDGRTLVNKIAAMTPADRERLIRNVAGVWDRNDEHFERDLLAMEV